MTIPFNMSWDPHCYSEHLRQSKQNKNCLKAMKIYYNLQLWSSTAKQYYQFNHTIHMLICNNLWHWHHSYYFPVIMGNISLIFEMHGNLVFQVTTQKSSNCVPSSFGNSPSSSHSLWNFLTERMLAAHLLFTARCYLEASFAPFKSDKQA